MNDQELLRYSRHILLDEIDIGGQQRLLNSAALVVGCGGLGAAALPYLAAAGVGRLLIADDDTVEWSNLQRQVSYGESDVGSLKTEKGGAGQGAGFIPLRAAPVRALCAGRHKRRPARGW